MNIGQVVCGFAPLFSSQSFVSATKHVHPCSLNTQAVTCDLTTPKSHSKIRNASMVLHHVTNLLDGSILTDMLYICRSRGNMQTAYVSYTISAKALRLLPFTVMERE